MEEKLSHCRSQRDHKTRDMDLVRTSQLTTMFSSTNWARPQKRLLYTLWVGMVEAGLSSWRSLAIQGSLGCMGHGGRRSRDSQGMMGI